MREHHLLTPHGPLTLAWEDGTALEADVARLGDMLLRMMLTGSHFAPGHTLRFGCFTLRFVAQGNGLALEEPAVFGDASRMVPGVSRAVALTRVQRSLLESYGAASSFDPPGLDETCRMCATIGGAARIEAQRAPAGEGESGWFFRCAIADHAHEEDSKILPLAQAIPIAPQLVELLPFPPGWSIAIDPDRVTVARDPSGHARDPRPDSYAAMLVERATLAVLDALPIVLADAPEVAVRVAEAVAASPSPARAADLLSARQPRDPAAIALDPRRLLHERGRDATHAHLAAELARLVPGLAAGDIDRAIAPMLAHVVVIERGGGFDPGDVMTREAFASLDPASAPVVEDCLVGLVDLATDPG